MGRKTSELPSTGHSFSKEPGRQPRAFRRLIICLLSLTIGLIWLCYGGKPPVPSTWGQSAPGSACMIGQEDFDWLKVKPSENVTWVSCFGGQKCARLSLPLDYDTPDGPKTEIALRMISATDTDNYQGTILVNPGGPGGSGTNLIERFGANISKVVGPRFDVLGFDPRGIGASTPQAQCFDSDSQLKLWQLNDRQLLSAKDNSISITRSRSELVSQRCKRAIGGTGEELLNGTASEWGIGRFMSTASVATDMLRITEKLGQGKLQYWGFSYGSVLGQYFAAMYPDKVGRLVIDGVYDAEDYRNGNWITNLEDTDATVSAFYDFCHQAGPDKCPIYASKSSDIRKRAENLIANVSLSPIPVPFAQSGPAIIQKVDLHMSLLEATYKPLPKFNEFANLIIALETSNQTALEAMVNGVLSHKCSCSKEELPWKIGTEAYAAIACGDAQPIHDEPDEYEKYLGKLTKKSAFGAQLWGQTRIACSQWKIRPKWRYTGPLAANKTSHPLLILSPTYDPVCPLSDARRVQTRYKDAALLVQNSVGHCSLSAPSVCTAKRVRAYFEKGTIPEEGAHCEVDEVPFIGAVGASVMSEEDQKLLVALKDLTAAVPMFIP